MDRTERGFWLRAPGEGEIRPVVLPRPAPDDVVVRTPYSGVSRGTDTLIFRGGVPESQFTVMRAPFRSLEVLADEGEVIELSWYGDRRVAVPLGEFFHSRRLTVKSSQVGGIPPGRRRTYADRLALALDLLADPAFDALITDERHFEDLPRLMPRLAGGDLSALCVRVVYGQG